MFFFLLLLIFFLLIWCDHVSGSPWVSHWQVLLQNAAPWLEKRLEIVTQKRWFLNLFKWRIHQKIKNVCSCSFDSPCLLLSTNQLKAMSKFICTSKKSANPAVRRCCRMPANAFPGCMSTVLLNAIDKATKEQSKKRKCPIS